MGASYTATYSTLAPLPEIKSLSQASQLSQEKALSRWASDATKKSDMPTYWVQG